MLFTASSMSHDLENDRDAAIITLAQLEVHRCALICSDGSAVQSEANLVDILTEIPSLYILNDDGLPIHRFDASNFSKIFEMFLLFIILLCAAYRNALSNPILSYSISSYFIFFYLILSYLISSHHILIV